MLNEDLENLIVSYYLGLCDHCLGFYIFDELIRDITLYEYINICNEDFYKNDKHIHFKFLCKKCKNQFFYLNHYIFETKENIKKMNTCLCSYNHIIFSYI